jgi:hypothetical protein
VAGRVLVRADRAPEGHLFIAPRISVAAAVPLQPGTTYMVTAPCPPSDFGVDDPDHVTLEIQRVPDDPSAPLGAPFEWRIAADFTLPGRML